MATPRRPSSLLNRAVSTPPTTPATILNKNSKPQPSQYPYSASILTPPTSPWQSNSSPDVATVTEFIETPQPQRKADVRSETRGEISIPTPEGPSVFECPFDVDIVKGDRGRDAIFGTGAWSIVYKATTRARTDNAIAHADTSCTTPPSSPKTSSLPVLVAVKKPTRRDATAILNSEARILAYISTVPYSEKYVVPFHGTAIGDPDQATLVLDALPLSLETHLRKRAFRSSQNFGVATMREPVIGGGGAWLTLANQLVSALAWLHNIAGVVHGDIKPGNILLSDVVLDSSGEVVEFMPVLADFSSAQRMDTDEVTPNTLAAMTREYTAPELLSSKVLRDPNARATPASDVFSLAVTLLVSATGQLLVYSGSVFQRQAMATQGWDVLEHVRSGEQGSRVPRHGVVERVLERAVLKRDMGRVSALTWLDVVERVKRGEPMKRN
ncbi:hypothetical protein H2202_001766 [Exophiala xenobiotica]|nr:hypothetical protein H2202_001766 [Exophiala xenobiotica]KAK5238524.1 hypothetical protein LTR47_000267 [Exophiala xenobiotica]KAK5325562.1 hypothetical protein LTR93_003782 [Exophiala xenobiotica]KAK5349751.1 hypothetical protein LTR61_006457 [Exophiala xenobiotica]KAK5387331.1 hypothetical protein LTR11_000996 [Exophiala xenobiotica]